MSQKGLERCNVSNKISKEIEDFIIFNVNLGRVELRKKLIEEFNLKTSLSFVQKFIQKHRKNNNKFKCKKDKNGRKILSEAQRKEISETLKNKNEQNRIKRLGKTEEQFFELGNKCEDFTEFKSHFTCEYSFLINCLKQWKGESSFYKVFNKQKIAWNKNK